MPPTYAAVEDVRVAISKDILVQLTDDENNGQVNASVVEAALVQAEGDVNAALAEAGYSVPVATPLPSGAGIIHNATVWLAICKLSARRGVIPEDYRFWCTHYTEKLDEIASGDLAVPIPGGSINDPQSNTESPDQAKIFTRSKFDNDGGRLNEEEEGSLDVV